MARVLVIGYRKGLSRALARRGIPYALWNDKPAAPLKTPIAAYYGQYPTGADPRPALEASGLAAAGPFTHVIAGTEAAVLAAGALRNALGARSSDQAVLLLCRDKLEMKRWLHPRGIPMTDFMDGTTGAAEAAARLGWPVVVKDRLLSGGRKMVFAEDLETLEREHGPGRILERFVDAPECSVESFVSEGRILFTNLTQYLERAAINIMPAGIDERTRDAVLALNARVISEIGVSWGITHLETYLTPGGPLFGEIALRPPGGYLMETLREAYGFNAWDALVAVELGLPFTFPVAHKRFAVSWIMHPGQGRVRDIEGLEEAKGLKAVREIKLKVAPGDPVSVRLGAGEDIGHVIVRADSREELLAELERVRRTLKVIME